MDEYGFSILMFIFSAVLFLYGLSLYIHKDSKMIARDYAAKMKNKKEYAKGVGVVMFFVSLAPIAGGLTALTVGTAWGLAALAAGLVIFIWLGIRVGFKKR